MGIADLGTRVSQANCVGVASAQKWRGQQSDPQALDSVAPEYSCTGTALFE